MRGIDVPPKGLAWLGIVGVFLGYYLSRKRRVEGERQQRLHGDAWVQWSRHVPEIFPRLTPWDANVRPWTYEHFSENDEGLMVCWSWVSSRPAPARRWGAPGRPRPAGCRAGPVRS